MRAIRVINTQDSWLKEGRIQVKIDDVSKETKLSNIAPRNVKKVSFAIPIPSNLKGAESVRAKLYWSQRRDINPAI